MRVSPKRVLFALLDLAALPFSLLFAPLAALLARSQNRTPASRRVFDWFNVALVRHHYYTPVVMPGDLLYDLSHERTIEGLDFNEAGQIALMRHFHYRAELLAIPLEKTAATEFGIHNATFEAGDAEILYDMIRYCKPRRIVEIGSGNSTLIARLAVQRNQAEDPLYQCDQICIEPFEQPWLETLPVKLIRSRVECCPDDAFTSLQAGDILFIDSSHVIRPQGDVVHEILHLLGIVRPGVIIQVHDIFTPRDYPARWTLGERWMRSEQYLLEAFLSFNRDFEVIAALNWLSHHHRAELAEACPILMTEPDHEPGSFWFRRVG